MNQIASTKDEHSVIHSTFTIERTYLQSQEPDPTEPLLAAGTPT